MNIVISSRLYYPLIGGTVRWVQMMAGELRRRGHQVTILTRTPGPPEGGTFRSPSFTDLNRLAAKSDVLIQVDVSWRDALPFLVKGVPWIPTIQFGRDPFNPPLRKRFTEEILRIGFRFGDTIPMSHETARSWGIDSPPIYNPYDQEEFHLPSQEDFRPVDFLFVGRMDRSKGIFLMLEVLEAMTAKESGIRAAFLGTGPHLDEFRERTSVSKPGLDLEVVGPADAAEVARWMRMSRILVLPTMPEWIEASPLVLVEAQACGCRIIAADSGGSKESLGPFGILVESGSAAKLFEAMLIAFQQPILTEAEVDAQSQFVESRSLKRIADQVEAKCREVCKLC